MDLKRCCTTFRWLAVRPSELLAVVGANGAGKSTLLRLLSGDLQPSTGAVQLAGQPLSQWLPAALARCQAGLTRQHTLALAFQVRELVLLGRPPTLAASRRPTTTPW